ncbi:MAG: exodeoxyribonuclease VII small subunit [Bacteroidales bacterium]|jgi:exodeoxyribonuclease VII small subunit|nr:exodeoxyribonuclease VII small subunit [Bacteroidales bacterium]
MAEKKITYQESIQEIEEIISLIEAKEIDVDSLTENIKRAVFLISECKKKLQTSDDEIQKLLKSIEDE